MTPIIARSTVPRACAMAVVSVRLPRPRLGRRAVSRMRARASAVSASTCLGARAWFRQPLIVSATIGWRAGLSPFGMPWAAWAWEIASRACAMEAMALPSAARWPR